MIFNSLYEINISLVGIIHQIMYLMYQINIDLISVGQIETHSNLPRKHQQVLKNDEVIPLDLVEAEVQPCQSWWIA